MSKAYVLRPTESTTTTDWNICALCQKVTKESLQCPKRSNRKPIGIGYVTLAEDLLRFQSLQRRPLDIQLARLDNGDGIESTLKSHEAQWHKTCRLQFNRKAFEMFSQREQNIATTSSTTVEPIISRLQTRSAYNHAEITEPICIFCNKSGASAELHSASTYELDAKVRKCALELEDASLLAKLATGDMIAIEAKYHRHCLISLYNKTRAKTINEDDCDNSFRHGIAFAELVAYLEDMNRLEKTAPIFKLTDLAQMYKDRLEQLGVHVEKRIHTTRLKDRLLSALPDLRSHVKGRDVILVFQKDIGDALLLACSHDKDAMDLMRAAKVIRKEMSKYTCKFTGTFKENCQNDAVPPSLVALTNMLLHGTKNHKPRQDLNQAALTISQLIMFNSTSDAPNSTHHAQSRETPISLYLAMKIHAVTRSKGLVDTMFRLGLCINYKRLLELTSDIANGICEQFMAKDLVCPLKLRHGLFTTAAVDNIDHNPSSATAKESFHGTSISLIQHPSHRNLGNEQSNMPLTCLGDTPNLTVSPLPSSYTIVPPASIKKKEFIVPAVQGPVRPLELLSTHAARETEKAWLSKVRTAVKSACAADIGWISWSAYYSEVQSAIIPPPIINSLLPLFIDSAHSTAMIRHSMDIVKKAVQYLNPTQTPVLTADQPLYAIAKQIQWTWPDTHGEEHFVIMFGGLHIEMVILKLLGDWLEDSGWTYVLVQAEITSSGTANSFINASHVTKTRHAHQVTAASLDILLQEAYKEACDADHDRTNNNDSEAANLTYDEWCQKRAKACVHFDYWLKTLSLELLLLRYIRSLREANFQLYVESLAQIMPWLFALDHTHYSRWLSVHIRDMMTLAQKHPNVLAEFMSGNFVAHKTSNKFSAMALDQCHEQNNALVKSSGGAIGLTNNPAALRRWMIAGPEISRVNAEFEDQINKAAEQLSLTESYHHDQQPKVQKDFLKDVNSLVTVFKEIGNPFLEMSQDLLVLDTNEIMDAQVADSVRNIETIGAEQYQEFVTKRLEECTEAVTKPIKKNNLPLFSRPPVRNKSKQKQQLADLKSDCSLFSRLYIACQFRDGDIDNFFAHENHATPPSLSIGGKMRMGTKADLLKCMETNIFEHNTSPKVEVTIFDGAAVVQMLPPAIAKTFQEYADRVFIPFMKSHLEKNRRVDVIWDTYLPDSLKSALREKRGKGTRKRVAPANPMPKNWKDFLHDNDNKTELFAFLSQQLAICMIAEDKQIFATNGRDVLCASASASDLNSLAPCSHEEADTRMILHLDDALSKGWKKLLIRTVDTDVVVLAVTFFEKNILNQVTDPELWIAFGAGANFRYIAIHELVGTLGCDKCRYLPIFHSFTGCDTVSTFAGRGKKTAWDSWRAFPEVNAAFEELVEMPEVISQHSQELIERFVVLMYDRTNECTSVNEARKQLFTQKSRLIENIPPTQAALVQHTRRACYQANVWYQSLTKDPTLPLPSDWGWEKVQTGWQPIWTTLPEASTSCNELIKCSCQKGCTGRCKCKKAALKCTAMCVCGGDCCDL